MLRCVQCVKMPANPWMDAPPRETGGKERAARTAPPPAATTNGDIERGAIANAKQEKRRRSDAGLSLGDMAKMRMAHDTVSKEQGK